MLDDRTTSGRRRKLLPTLLLSVILIASFVPTTHALDTFKTFNGNLFIDVPNSSNIQLDQFTIEIRFRIMEDPNERGYLVSKRSVGSGNPLLDQNYALYITPLKRLVGGFKALDGSYNYVYTPAISLSNWHVAKLVYDGSVLRLSVNGEVFSSLEVGKVPDAEANDDLRIGANAYGDPAKFFVGDIDHVTILDRSTFAKVYFNDFNGSTSSSSTTDCSKIPMSQLRGAVFRDPILGTLQNGGSVNAPWNEVSESMKYIKANGMNLVRVPYYWEAYVHDPSAFLDEMELIAKIAEDNDICVIFANFHWYTSSYWNIEIIGNSDGRGFPSFVVKNFPVKNNDYDATAGPFWNAFLSNDIVIDDRKVWDLQAEFFSKVIDKVDVYKSVAGYEILNEPHLYDSSQYEKLGNYHTYMAGVIRDATDKKIFFDRETTRGFPRQPSLEYKIVPRGVSDLVYAPHLYSVPMPGSQAEKQLDNFYQWSEEWEVEILVGEWAAGTQAETDIFVKAFKAREFGWTYYAWKPTADRGGGSELYQSDSSPPTVYLEYLTNSLDTFF